MATSGQDPWLPSIGAIIDEAFEYAGVDPATATARHLASAIRSMNSVYQWLENEGEALFRDDIETVIVNEGQATFFVPPGTLSIKSAHITEINPPSNQSELLIYAKASWFEMPDRNQRGRPTVLALNFSAPMSFDGIQTDTDALFDPPLQPEGYGEGGYGDGPFDGPALDTSQYTPGGGPQAILWPIPEKSYRISYRRVRQSQRAVLLSENADAHAIWTSAIIFRLAHYLALKYNVSRADKMEVKSLQYLNSTKLNNRESDDTRIHAVSFSPVRGGGRRRGW